MARKVTHRLHNDIPFHKLILCFICAAAACAITLIAQSPAASILDPGASLPTWPAASLPSRPNGSWPETTSNAPERTAGTQLATGAAERVGRSPILPIVWRRGSWHAFLAAAREDGTYRNSSPSQNS